MYLTKLTRTPRLFFVSVISAGSFRNCLSVRNPRFFKFNRYFLIMFQSPLQCTKMKFSLTVYQCLPQFLRLLYHPSRIFFAHAIKNTHHLFYVSFVDRFNGSGIFRIGIFNKIKFIATILSIQGIPCLYIL